MADTFPRSGVRSVSARTKEFLPVQLIYSPCRQRYQLHKRNCSPRPTRHGSRARQMGTNRRFFHDCTSRRALDRGNAYWVSHDRRPKPFAGPRRRQSSDLAHPQTRTALPTSTCFQSKRLGIRVVGFEVGLECYFSADVLRTSASRWRSISSGSCSSRRASSDRAPPWARSSSSNLA